MCERRGRQLAVRGGSLDALFLPGLKALASLLSSLLQRKTQDNVTALVIVPEW